jgi:hypothetical protein
MSAPRRSVGTPLPLPIPLAVPGLLVIRRALRRRRS